jgi:hypothetical protein
MLDLGPPKGAFSSVRGGRPARHVGTGCLADHGGGLDVAPCWRSLVEPQQQAPGFRARTLAGQTHGASLYGLSGWLTHPYLANTLKRQAKVFFLTPPSGIGSLVVVSLPSAQQSLPKILRGEPQKRGMPHLSYMQQVRGK